MPDSQESIERQARVFFYWLKVEQVLRLVERLKNIVSFILIHLPFVRATLA